MIRLVDNFRLDKAALKTLIDENNENEYADVLVKENEIVVKPHKYADLPDMKMRECDKKFYFDKPRGYYVDYSAHDFYPPFENGYYTINRYIISKINDLRYVMSGLGNFGKLFVGACHIAEDIKSRKGAEISEKIKKDNELSKSIDVLNVEIRDEL